MFSTLQFLFGWENNGRRFLATFFLFWENYKEPVWFFYRAKNIVLWFKSDGNIYFFFFNFTEFEFRTSPHLGMLYFLINEPIVKPNNYPILSSLFPKVWEILFCLVGLWLLAFSVVPGRQVIVLCGRIIDTEFLLYVAWERNNWWENGREGKNLKKSIYFHAPKRKRCYRAITTRMHVWG